MLCSSSAINDKKRILYNCRYASSLLTFSFSLYYSISPRNLFCQAQGANRAIIAIVLPSVALSAFRVKCDFCIDSFMCRHFGFYTTCKGFRSALDKWCLKEINRHRKELNL